MAPRAGRPITFLEGAAFQWLNPKGWVMAVGAISTYAAVATFPHNVLLIAFLFGSLGILSSATWLGFGTSLRQVLKSPRTVRAVNITHGGAAGGLTLAHPRRRVEVSPAPAECVSTQSRDPVAADMRLCPGSRLLRFAKFRDDNGDQVAR